MLMQIKRFSRRDNLTHNIAKNMKTEYLLKTRFFSCLFAVLGFLDQKQ